MKFRYIRTPKTLTLSTTSGYNITTCELFDGIHDLIVIGAEKICRKMNTNYDILQYVDKDYYQLLTAFIIGQVSTPSNERK